MGMELGSPWETQLLECFSDARVFFISCCLPCAQLAHQKAVCEDKEFSIVYTHPAPAPDAMPPSMCRLRLPMHLAGGSLLAALAQPA
eukprot:gene3527-biopygen49